MVLIDSQDGGLKALRALPIPAPAASHEALKRERPPTLPGGRPYSRLTTPKEGSRKEQPDLSFTRGLSQPLLGKRWAWAWAVGGNQSFNPIDRCYPCPKASSFPN